MSEIPKGEDPRPSWLVNIQAADTTLSSIEIDGAPYTYTVIRAGMAPGLPYTVGYPEETALMVSEDTPEAYRRFVLAHEVREKTRFSDLPEEKRCSASLRLELEEVRLQSPELFAEYVKNRIAFFNALVLLYERPEQATAVSDGFRAGIVASRDLLENLR